MFKFCNLYKLYQEAGGEGTPGGGGPNGTPPTAPLDVNSPEVRALIESATNALKAKNEELIGEKRKLTELVGDIDQDTLKSYIERLKNDEESRLIAEGKVDEVVNRRTQRMRDSYQSKLDEYNAKLNEKDTSFKSLKSQYDNVLIDNAIRDAATRDGVIPTAIDDIIMRARQHFQVDNDRLVSVDPDTKDVRLGADGKTPYSPSDFMADLKAKAPHFWPSSSGGGYSPGSGSNSTADLQHILQTKGYDAYRQARAKAKKE